MAAATPHRPTPGNVLLTGACLARNHLIAPILGIALALLAAIGGGVLLALDAAPAKVPWLLAGAGAAGGGALYWLIHRIQTALVEPLHDMRIWAYQIRAGDLTARVPSRGNGECALLAQDINQLSDEFRLLKSEMESQVEQQTQILERQNKDLQLLYEAAAAINTADDLDRLLARFLYTFIALIGAQAGAVRVFTSDGLRTAASYGIHASASTTPDEASGLEAAAQLQKVEIPIQYRNRTLGTYTLWGHPDVIDMRPDANSLFTSIGQHLGIAVERANLGREATRLSIMEERAQLAHELHDSLAQTVASMRLQANMLGKAINKHNNIARDRHLRTLTNTVNEAYAEIRELITHFRAPLDKRGLIPSLESLMDRFRKQTDIAAFLQIPCKDINIPADVEMQVLRIIQESLANIRKHSQAQTVRVMICCDDAGYHLLVEDDGVGFEPQASEIDDGEHIGLSIMHQRARRVGGALTLESEPGEGTRIMIDFPRDSRCAPLLVH